MKILSIGNSFSQDAHRWLHKLAEANGTELECFNLYIGGCSLGRHWNNVQNDAADYDLEINAENIRKISIKEALEMEKYDVITLQQVSHSSGRPQTYFPYLTKLAEYVRAAQPEAELYFHRTWAYEIDSGHEGFKHYNNDQNEMYRRIMDSSEMAAEVIGAKLIPAGSAIQLIRENIPEFDYKNGGLSLHRDGFHLSLDYGRFAAAACWYKTLIGEKLNIEKFEDFDSALIRKIIDAVESM